MSTAIVAVVFALAWVLIGLASFWWMARHGHRSRWWLLIAALLGPIFAVAARERAERTPREIEHWLSRGTPGGWPRVLIGVDGSAESEQALRSVVDLLGPGVGTLLLVTVVDYDADAETDDGDPRLAQAHDRLVQTASGLSGREVACEVVAGTPAAALLRCAAEQKADLIVVGRRGHGMSTHLLGSVSAALLRATRTPVLIGAAVPSPARRKGVRTGRQDR